MNIENLNKRLANIINNQGKINADIEELNRHVEELKQEELEKENTPLGWIPEEGEYYFYVNIYRNIEATTNDKTRIDTKVIKHTRVFKTRKEAEFEAERMKVLRELEKFACEFEYDYGSYKGNYYIYYDCHLNQLLVGNSIAKCHELYFESKEKAKEAIEAVGEERVKKYYLGVTN